MKFGSARVIFLCDGGHVIDAACTQAVGSDTAWYDACHEHIAAYFAQMIYAASQILLAVQGRGGRTQPGAPLNP
jgi:hypothetical protein